MVFPSRAKFAQDKPDRLAVGCVVESGVAVAEPFYGRSTELLEFFDGAAQMEMINEPLLGRIAQSTPPCVKSKRPGLPGTDCPPQTMRRVGRILGRWASDSARSDSLLCPFIGTITSSAIVLSRTGIAECVVCNSTRKLIHVLDGPGAISQRRPVRIRMAPDTKEQCS